MNAPTPHRERMAHLDTAGTGRMTTAVRAVLTECVRLEDRYGPYGLEEHLGDVLHTEIHRRLAQLLNVPAADTALFTGAAAAYHSFVSRIPLGPGDRIWTTPYEDVANLTTLYALRNRTRCRLEVVPLSPDGDLDLEWMATHIDNDVALVSVAHVPSSCGIANPVEAVGRILAPHRCLYAVDASYAVGQLPVDAARIGCHLLTGDAWRFLRGPQTVGFAYVAPRLEETLAEAGPIPAALPESAAVAALNAALADHTQTAEAPRETLLAQLRAAVQEIPGTELIAPGRVQSGILTFRHSDLPAALIRHKLAAHGVAVWKTVPQQTPLLMPERAGTTAVRASVHHDNSAQDVARLGQALREILHQARPRPARALPRTPHAVAPMAGPGRHRARRKLCLTN